jgi:hypothetical protein
VSEQEGRKLSCFNILVLGGAEGIRTPDLCSAIAALSHLSYSPGRLNRAKWRKF